MNEKERIELLMKCYDLSPSQFSERTGIQRASVSHIISGRNKPSLEVMLKIYEAFPGIDIKWLMTGIGEEPGLHVQQPAGTPADNLFQAQEPAMSPQAENGLFALAEPAVPVQQPVEGARRSRHIVPMPQPLREKPATEPRTKRTPAARVAQMASMQPEKKIKEVRIFYTDGTYETLVPER